MPSLENPKSLEIVSSSDDNEETQTPFDPIEQRLKGCIDLANKEYKENFGKDFPEGIRELLSQALNGKDEEERDEILDEISNTIQTSDNQYMELKNYLEMITGEQETDSLKHNKKEDNLKENSLKESVTQLINSLSTLNGTGKNYNTLLKQIKFLESVPENELKKQVENILSQLNNPKTLLSISQDLQTQDQQNGTHNFDNFKTSVNALLPEFNFDEKLALAQTQAKLALGTDTLQNTTTTNQGYKVNNDGFAIFATQDGKSRTINRTDSNYTLKSNLDTTTAQQEAQKITNDLNKALEPIEKSLNTIKTLKDYLNTAKTQETPLETLKNELQAINLNLYIQLGLDFSNSPDEILNRLITHENELNNKKSELQTRADKARDKLIATQKEKAQGKDEIRKTVLNFIHQIGFDTLPQTTTDTIIANINANLVKYGLQRPIDLENGSLGFDMDL